MPFIQNSEFSQDANSTPIPVMAFGGSARIASVGGASSRVTLPSPAGEGSIVRIAVTQDCYIAFGDNTVTASVSDVLFVSGAVEYVQVPLGATDIAAIDPGASGGTLTVTVMQ